MGVDILMRTYKFKLLLKSVFVFLIVGIVFVGCRPTLQARYVDSAEADTNMKFYMSEIDKLLVGKGYDKIENSGIWINMYQLNCCGVYELDDNTLFVFGTKWYEGEESFTISVLSLNNNFLDNSVVHLPLVSEVLTRVSGYDISEKYLNNFCDNAKRGGKYNDGDNYMSDKKIDSNGYYDLFYVTNPSEAVSPVGEYNTVLLVRGLTKTGLETQHTGDGSLC